MGELIRGSSSGGHWLSSAETKSAAAALAVLFFAAPSYKRAIALPTAALSPVNCPPPSNVKHKNLIVSACQSVSFFKEEKRKHRIGDVLPLNDQKISERTASALVSANLHISKRAQFVQ